MLHIKMKSSVSKCVGHTDEISLSLSTTVQVLSKSNCSASGERRRKQVLIGKHC